MTEHNISHIAVLLTVFNRKEVTLQGLASLFSIEDEMSNFDFDVFMVDDGSTDGTSEAVHGAFPKVNIIKGNGTLYWSGGMRKAWNMAVCKNDYDYYIWFNDDAILNRNAFKLLFEPISKYGDNIIVCGAFCDNQGNVSYGGRDDKEKLLTPGPRFKNIYLMNGNFTLIPHKVFKEVGNIANCFQHSYGDWDYGIRALKSGFGIKLTRDYVGVTNRHDFSVPTYYSQSSLSKRISTLKNPTSGFIDSLRFYYRLGKYSLVVRNIVFAGIRILFPIKSKV